MSNSALYDSEAHFEYGGLPTEDFRLVVEYGRDLDKILSVHHANGFQVVSMADLSDPHTCATVLRLHKHDGKDCSVILHILVGLTREINQGEI